MIQINFDPRFADSVASGEKRQTIRRNAECVAGFAFFNSWEPHFTVREWITTAGEWLDVDTSRCEGICFILPDDPAWQASGETPLQYYARLAETARAANTEETQP